MTIHDIQGGVAFFACGGTIDKIYFDAKSAYSVGDPAAIDIARRARAALAPPASLLKKDSLEMDDADRALVARAVAECAAARIVISHGTDTMAATARAIEAIPAAAAKTTVLVGAWLPAVFRDSDADFNIGFALASALLAAPGVYIAMNGRLLPAAVAAKDRAAGVFTADNNQ